MNRKNRIHLFFVVMIICMFGTSGVFAAEPIKIGMLRPLSGFLEYFGNQGVQGFKLGLEYATNGTNKILGRDVELIVVDTQCKPERGKMLLTKLYKDDKVDLAVGPGSSAVALACLPVAKEFKKVLNVDLAAATSINSSPHWNRYVFHSVRNMYMDAKASALVAAKPGVSIAAIAQDYAFGRDAVAAYKEVAEQRGAKVVHVEIADPKATDFTAPILKMIEALKGKSGPKYIWVCWAGKGGPYNQLMASGLEKYGIQMTSHGNVFSVLKMQKPLKGMTGGTYYYYEIPKNPVNDWFVKEHMKRYNEPPDFFHCEGFTSAMAIVAGIQKAGSTDAEKLITAMEGMEFKSPKGTCKFRKEDHQVLEPMYIYKLDVKPDVEWAIPTLVRELSPEEAAPPIFVK